MDKFGFSTLDSGYNSSSMILVAVLFFSMLTYFLKNWISNYMKKRSKQKDLADKYNKKLECRNGLAVSLFLY